MMMDKKTMVKRIVLFLFVISFTYACSPCYEKINNQNCQEDGISGGIESHTLHMSVHPHLDAYWIFDFENYYDPSPNNGKVMGYFRQNKFNSVKEIFTTALRVLKDSKQFREVGNFDSQKAHRSFFNSEIGFFKRWYYEQSEQSKVIVKELLKTKYWEILGGGYVQHDEGCAYYDDIIQNYQTGLHFLKEQFDYQPKAAVSADSFGHSQSTLAILAHLGVQGYFVQRSDEHILKQNKTQFIWKAKSANGKYYGALPTHIRWAIHGFEDQFNSGSSSEQICQTKKMYIKNMQKQNEFLRTILKSDHIMRYFGHDFQRFDEQSYYVIEGIMEQFSLEKCKKVSAVYTNPTEYFKILMGSVFNKVKPAATRTEDIMPIWDYDSGLYWTGYYTTDPWHKKNYRDAGRYLHAIRKAFFPLYIQQPNSTQHIEYYKNLEELAEIVTYLQHHDGISGTSKYEVMDQYENMAGAKIKTIKQSVEKQIFQAQFSEQINKQVFECSMESECTIPKNMKGDVYLKVFNSGGQTQREPIIVHLHENQIYEPECDYYQINCLCTAFPCPCSLYIFTKISTYTLIKLKQVQVRPKDANLIQQIPKQVAFGSDQSLVKAGYNQTHFQLGFNQKKYYIGYKKLSAEPTPRRYKHLSRYGSQVDRSFTVRSGKYALGNNVLSEKSLSKIRKVYKLETEFMKKFIILWQRQQMKTTITIINSQINQWKVETYSAAETGKLEDLYLQIYAPHINNKNTFFTDSNGWLVMKRQLYKHEDYKAFFSDDKFDEINGNSYPMTSFVYLQDAQNPKEKISVNTDRPQGVTAYHQGTIWINYDRLTSDDGKWVFETTYRSEYQKFTHYITVDNIDYNERKIQRRYDQPLLINGYQSSQNLKIEQQTNKKQKEMERTKWSVVSGLDNIKFLLKPWNDTTVLLRVHNLHDENKKNVGLYSNLGNIKISTFLTAYYGSLIQFDSIEETTLGGNMQYSQFIKKKWNWDSVIDLKQQNSIFDKILSEKIILRPLQIRTFLFKGVKIGQQCMKVDQLKYNSGKIQYKIDTTKPMPQRAPQEKANEIRITDYLLHGDHCQEPSPVLKNETTVTLDKIIEISRSENIISESKQYSIPVLNNNQPSLQIQKTVKPQKIQKKIDVNVEPVKEVNKNINPEVNTNKNPNIRTDQIVRNDVNNDINENVNKDTNKDVNKDKSQTQSPPNVDDSKQIQAITIKVETLQLLTKAQKTKYFDNVLIKLKDRPKNNK